MQRQLRRSLRYSVLPFALLVLLVAGLVWQIARMGRAARWVDHSEAVIAQIDQVQASLTDQETGLRGYLLSEQASFLEPYTSATTLAELDHLEQLVGDDPAQVARARALRADYLGWQREAAQAISHPAAGRSPARLTARKQETDAMRARVQAMLAVENQLHAARDATAAHDEVVAEIGAGVVLVVACALGVLVARRAVQSAVATYEDALRRSATSEMRLRRLWESNILGVMYTTIDGRITDANDAVLRMIGYTRDDVRAGRARWADMTPPEYAAVDDHGHAESLASGACTPYEKEYIAKDGRRVPILIGYALLEGEGGEYICFLLDLTERAKLLAGERAARAEAMRESRLKDEFVATVSHELRTPLNAILGWTKLLQRPSVAAEQLAKGLDVIDRNTHQLTQLVSDLLDTSRIVAGKLSVEPEPVDLSSVVEGAIEALRSTATAKGVALEADLEPLDGVLHADPRRLRQVVDNLVSNAIKFTPKGGRVSVVVASRAESVLLRVRDTGEGIAPEFLPHVFDRFRQADASATRRHGGLGLGLAIVKHVVDLHCGTIDVQSEGLGKGAQFTVTLPIRPPPALVRSASAPQPGGACLAGLRILVVDDEPDARELAQRVLEEGGATVVPAASGAEALAVAIRQGPDVVISDIGMPGMDGYDLAGRLRAEPGLEGVPMLAVTAFARPEDCARALAAGFDAHLAKPMEPATLIAAVCALVRRGARRPAEAGAAA